MDIRLFGVGPILEGMAAVEAKKMAKKSPEVLAKWKSMNA